jgi:hypothetical protein
LEPVSIAPDAIFWWPFNLKLYGVTFVHATAQPFSHILEANGTRTLFFAATPGVATEFVFAADGIAQLESTGHINREGGRIIVRGVQPGHTPVVRLATTAGDVTQCVLLDEADSLAFWKGPFAGRNRVVLGRASMVFDHEQVRATCNESVSLSIFPVPGAVAADGRTLTGEGDGLFQRYALSLVASPAVALAFERVQPAGPLREIKNGPIRQPVAAAPGDADFAAAAVWRIKLPHDLDLARNPILRFRYVGDVARVMLDGRMLTDDFYNGNAFEVGLRRFAPAILKGDLRISILPLQKGAPIFLAKSAQPDFGEAASVAKLEYVELVQSTTVTLVARPADEPKLPNNFKNDALQRGANRLKF